MAWLLASDTVEGHLFSAGDRLPVGVAAFPGKEANDVVLWVESPVRSSPATRSSTSARASRFRPSADLTA